MKTTKQSAKKSLSLVALESIITAGILSVPIMTPFFHSIGMSQSEIALSQVVFTAVLMILNIPAGYIADRFSRKWANILGDLGCAAALLFYATAQNFTAVVIAEVIFGISLAFSQGVDTSLIKHFSSKIDNTGKLFKTISAKVAALMHAGNLILMLLGGPIGAIDFRLAIALSSATFIIGAIICLFIHDDSENLSTQHKNPLKDIAKVITTAIKTPALRLRLCAYAVVHEITHGIIWVFTPLMLLAGVPLPVVSLGWVFNALTAILGAKLAEKFAHKLQIWQVFTLPIALISLSFGIMSIHINFVTIWLYLSSGIVLGWSSATMIPLIQQEAKPSEQTSIVSLAKTITRLLYIPAVWIIGLAADIDLRLALLATTVIFIPLSIPIAIKLKREP